MSETTETPVGGEPLGSRGRRSVPRAHRGGGEGRPGERLSEAEFQRIFERYWPWLLRFFSRPEFSREEAEDLTQESFLRVYKGRRPPSAEGELKRWLIAVAANVRRNALRDRNAQKRQGNEASLAASGEEPRRVEEPGPAGSAPSDTPLDACLDRERREIVREALAELPPQMRRCLVFRHFQEKKYKEIAVLMNISIETVKAHLYQGRNRLAEVVERRRDGQDRGSGS